MTITEATATDSRLSLIQKLLNKAESTDSESESIALTERAAELMARYGIDRAMLAESGRETDPVTDTVIFAQRPYARPMMELLYRIASALGAESRSVKQWDPEDKGGRTRGAWHYGLRLFIHESDLLRVNILYASLRNQAIAGASRISGTAEYGQDARAYRINYLDGFSSAIHSRLRAAEQAAREAAGAEQQELADRAMLAGTSTTSRPVELVLADRRVSVRNAMNLALYGRSSAELAARDAADNVRWAEIDREAKERRDARKAEQSECAKCQSARSGYCSRHRDMKPAAGRAYYESVGSGYRYDGFRDGQKADLGTTGPQVTGDSRKALS
jgi:hypothetical protein